MFSLANSFASASLSSATSSIMRSGVLLLAMQTPTDIVDSYIFSFSATFCFLNLLLYSLISPVANFNATFPLTITNISSPPRPTTSKRSIPKDFIVSYTEPVAASLTSSLNFIISVINLKLRIICPILFPSPYTTAMWSLSILVKLSQTTASFPTRFLYSSK